MSITALFPYRPHFAGSDNFSVRIRPNGDALRSIAGRDSVGILAFVVAHRRRSERKDRRVEPAYCWGLCRA